MIRARNCIAIPVMTIMIKDIAAHMNSGIVAILMMIALMKSNIVAVRKLDWGMTNHEQIS